MSPLTAPFGSWQSPIEARLAAAHTRRFGDLAMTADAVLWSEGRPSEGGRNALVEWTPGGGARDLLAPPWNTRTRVHEYGGGAFCVAGREICFTHDDDQRIYRVSPNAADPPRPVSAESRGRFADLKPDLRRGRLIAVHESGHGETAASVVNRLVALPLEGGELRPLAEGHDFFASPALSPDGSRLAWIAWDHPNMPWDGSELWLGELNGGGEIRQARRIAGGREESIFQPSWSPDGHLHFVSDRTGWWNLYRFEGDGARPLHPMEAELGLPQWVFGMSTYAFVDAHRLVCAYAQEGSWSLAELELANGELRPLDLPYTHIEAVRARGTEVAFLGAAPELPQELVLHDLDSGHSRVLRKSTDLDVDPDTISVPRSIRFESSSGTAYAFFYPPHNAKYRGPDDERPILLVKSHGGPTAASTNAYSIGIQFWTSRGFAVVDVNYGGSTGYGRAYRQRLDGRWGIVDVDDCVAAARYLADLGEVDPRRLVIRGGSAGGFTTLAALAFRDVFAAGASHYGVGDLEALARDTHKFESRYLDRLVGPYPERRDLYRERSPIHAVERLSCAVIFFQGLEDRIVPPAQAEAMVEALERKGLPVAYVPFAGEQHGFRRAENIVRALEGELYFYSRVLGFELADAVEPVPIANI